MMGYQQAKRVGDLVFVFAVGIGLCWLVVLIVLLYLFSGQMPILYQQVRTGLHGKPFVLYKFRTLSVDEHLLLQQRTFWLGTFLRKTSLDELPQLWNVLKGEMSIVGPRPLPVAYFPLYSTAQQQRHDVLPGITGLAQVRGRHSISWEEKFEWDVYYVKHFSFSIDCIILWKTFVLLINSMPDVSLEEKPFTGSSHE